MSRAVPNHVGPSDGAIHANPVDEVLPIERDRLPRADGAGKLERLLNRQLPALLQSAVSLEKLRVLARRVDGRIIGTGEADFTKGNTLYTLNFGGKTFQLIDVPGIEGDESKYKEMVREAVAKAHLVFYVNGTNKKPEKATAAKIRSYLRRGTQVCPLVNVRGNADAYEFDEDRESLESNGGTRTALQQTMKVLKSVLGPEVLQKGHCVQGLLAFSSLAMSFDNRNTSIHPSRERDLVTQQRNYLRHFTSCKAMCEFSQIDAVAQVLHAKLGTFKEDIVESNKTKVRELLIENIGVLQKMLTEHQAFIDRVEPNFKTCRDGINQAFLTFKRLTTAGRKNLWNEFFNGLTDEADKIVEEHFGDGDQITARIKKAFRTRKSDMRERLQEQSEEHIEGLEKSMSEAMERLVQDVRRVEFQQRVIFDDGGQKAVYHATELDMEIGLGGWGSIAFNVGSYAVTGATIGSGFAPGLGTAIGAAIGVVVGALVSVMHLFTSRERRIRKAQAKVQEKIDEVRDQVMGGLSEEIENLIKPVRKEVKETTLNQVDAIYASLTRPLAIIQRQIALMSNMKDQLGEMPYGTIQAIQC